MKQIHLFHHNLKQQVLNGTSSSFFGLLIIILNKIDAVFR